MWYLVKRNSITRVTVRLSSVPESEKPYLVNGYKEAVTVFRHMLLEDTKRLSARWMVLTAFEESESTLSVDTEG